MPSSECPICFTDYDTGQHKIMNGSCGHSLCLECCSRLVEATCPFCKRTRSFSNAAPNYLAMEMLTTSPTCSNTVNASPLTQETVDEIITQVTKALIDRTDASVHSNKDRPMHDHGSNSRNTHTGNIEGLALEKQQIREEKERQRKEEKERRRAEDESRRLLQQREREEEDKQRKEEERRRRRAEDESRRLLQQREREEEDKQRKEEEERRQRQEEEERRRERFATTILAVVSAIFLVASIIDLIVGLTFGSADYRHGNNVTHLIACIVDMSLYLFLLTAALIRKFEMQKLETEIESQTTRQYTRVGEAAQAGRLSWDITNVGVFFIVANNIFTFFLIIFWFFNGFSWPITIDFISRGVLFPFIFVIGIGISVYIYISDTINGKKLQPGIWFIALSAIFLAVSISDLIVGFTSGSADYSSGKNAIPLAACFVDILIYLFLIIAGLLREKVLQSVGFFLVPVNIFFTFILIMSWILDRYSWPLTIDFISRGVVLAVPVTMCCCVGIAAK